MNARIKKGAEKTRNTRKKAGPTYDINAEVLDYIDRFLESKKNEYLGQSRCNSCSSTSNTRTVYEHSRGAHSNSSSTSVRVLPHRRNNLDDVKEDYDSGCDASNGSVEERGAAYTTRRRFAAEDTQQSLTGGGGGGGNDATRRKPSPCKSKAKFEKTRRQLHHYLEDDGQGDNGRGFYHEEIKLASKTTGRTHTFSCFKDSELCFPPKYQKRIVEQKSDEDKETDEEQRQKCAEFIFDHLKKYLEEKNSDFDASQYELTDFK